jgi:branched-chain amino acid transport system permease protein
LSRLGGPAARARSLVALLLMMAFVLLVAGAAGEALHAVAINAAVYLIFVVGTYVFVGVSGTISFGQVGFAAVGAYVSAIVTMPAESKALVLPDLPVWLAKVEVPLAGAAMISAVVAAIVAVIVAVPLMRLRGIAAGIATFAVLVIIYDVLLNWKQVTGGAGTLSGIPLDLGLGTALVVAMIVVVVAFWYQGSRWGLRLRASREEEVAARAAGVGIELQRGIAFVLSAAIMGVGGCLYAHQQGVLTPNGFFLGLTFLTLAMLTIGGTRSLSGAVVGTLVIAAVQEIFRRLSSGGEGIGPVDLGLPAGTAPVFIAALMLLVMARRPEGITRGRELGDRFRRR